MGSQEDCAASRREEEEEEEEKQKRVMRLLSGSEEEGKLKTVTLTLTLTSNDGEVFEVEAAAAARQSVLVQNMMELGLAADGITLPVVSGDVLALAVAYVSRHSKGQGGRDEHGALKDFDRDLVKGLDDDTLFDLLSAADYMRIEGLYKLTCQTVADMIAHKTIEEVREVFSIQNDYTSEEEAELRAEISWALE